MGFMRQSKLRQMRCIPVLLFVFLAIQPLAATPQKQSSKLAWAVMSLNCPQMQRNRLPKYTRRRTCGGQCRPVTGGVRWRGRNFRTASSHPLAVKFSSAGLRIFYPKNITVGAKGIFGGMPGAGDDFVLGHDGQAEFPDARVDGFSDWFVTARMRQGANALTVTYGHGSPFVFALYAGGNPRLTFTTKPRIWSTAQSAALAITIREKHYGLSGRVVRHGRGWMARPGPTNSVGGIISR